MSSLAKNTTSNTTLKSVPNTATWKSSPAIMLKGVIDDIKESRYRGAVEMGEDCLSEKGEKEVEKEEKAVDMKMRGNRMDLNHLDDKSSDNSSDNSADGSSGNVNDENGGDGKCDSRAHEGEGMENVQETIVECSCDRTADDENNGLDKKSDTMNNMDDKQTESSQDMTVGTEGPQKGDVHHTTSTNNITAQDTHARVDTSDNTQQSAPSIMDNPLAECPICMETLDLPHTVITTCGHIMCTHCAVLLIKVNKKCPICSAALGECNAILSVCLSVCQSVCLSVCLSVGLIYHISSDLISFHVIIIELIVVNYSHRSFNCCSSHYSSSQWKVQ